MLFHTLNISFTKKIHRNNYKPTFVTYDFVFLETSLPKINYLDANAMYLSSRYKGFNTNLLFMDTFNTNIKLSRFGRSVLSVSDQYIKP